MNKDIIIEILSGIKSGKSLLDLIYDEKHDLALNECIQSGYVSGINAIKTNINSYAFSTSESGINLTESGEKFLIS